LTGAGDCPSDLLINVAERDKIQEREEVEKEAWRRTIVGFVWG
jgi:hypothetical protein